MASPAGTGDKPECHQNKQTQTILGLGRTNSHPAVPDSLLAEQWSPYRTHPKEQKLCNISSSCDIPVPLGMKPGFAGSCFPVEHSCMDSVPLAMMSSSSAFSSKEYTLFSAQLPPFLCSTQLLETLFCLAQTGFLSCFCHKFNTTNLIANFFGHCWLCTQCIECTKMGIYIFLVERRV